MQYNKPVTAISRILVLPEDTVKKEKLGHNDSGENI